MRTRCVSRGAGFDDTGHALRENGVVANIALTHVISETAARGFDCGGYAGMGTGWDLVEEGVERL